MFENLDDSTEPTPAPLDGVVARGRKLRMHRRMVAGAAVMFVLAGTIATAAAFQGGHKRVVVQTESTSSTAVSTTVPDTATTVPESTTSTSPAVPLTSVPGTVATTTSTTQPPHDPHDLSLVTISWPADTPTTSLGCPGETPCNNVFAMNAGEAAPLTYTVTNNGSWQVELDECAANTVDIWTTPATSGFGQYSEGAWPQPYPARNADAQPETCTRAVTFLGPGASETRTETIIPGYRNAAGDIMPAAPGLTSFVPSFLPQCAQPCTTYPPRSLAVSVFPPQLPATVYSVDLKTKPVTAASGDSTPVEITFTNPLAFTVRVPLLGPCWKVTSGAATADCSQRLAAIIVGPHATVDLTGTVWARQGFVASGAPLAPGTYEMDLGDQPNHPFTVT